MTFWYVNWFSFDILFDTKVILILDSWYSMKSDLWYPMITKWCSLTMIPYRDTYVDILIKVLAISSDVCGYSGYSEHSKKTIKRDTYVSFYWFATPINRNTHTHIYTHLFDIRWYSMITMIFLDIQCIWWYSLLLIGYFLKLIPSLFMIFKYFRILSIRLIFSMITLIFYWYSKFLYEQTVSFWLSFKYPNLFRLLNRQIRTLFGHRGDIHLVWCVIYKSPYQQ